MKTVDKAVEVNVPVRTAYNQWTQFEDFPQFMEGVEEVRQLDDKSLHWKAKIAGQEREWKASITEQIPDERIAWEGDGEMYNAGVVTFHRIDDTTTRVMLQIGYETETMTEKAGDMLGMISGRIEGDLKRFKKFIEERGAETGGWRGEIPRPKAAGE